MEEWKKNIKKKNPNGEILALLDKYGNDTKSSTILTTFSLFTPYLLNDFFRGDFRNNFRLAFYNLYKQSASSAVTICPAVIFRNGSLIIANGIHSFPDRFSVRRTGQCDGFADYGYMVVYLGCRLSAVIAVKLLILFSQRSTLWIRCIRYPCACAIYIVI